MTSVSVLAMVACCAATVACGLHVFHRGEDGAGLYVVAFLDVQVRDAAEGGGADVDVGLGLDLAGAADGGDQVLRGRLCRWRRR